MQTALSETFRASAAGQTADSILRSCVHCGFCNATCPTYQLLGDELDGPRGRIYLIKQVLEGAAPTATTRLHLDRCLTCRACETTCPSGVRYGELLDIGRAQVERRSERSAPEKILRWLLRQVLPYPARFTPLLRIGQAVRPLLPARLGAFIPAKHSDTAWPQSASTRQMILLDGCVQGALAPDINAAAARVLDRLGIRAVRVPQAGCCGALSHHLNATEEAHGHMRRQIDALWPLIDEDCEAIISTASGCGVHIKEYGRLLGDDPRYAQKAARIAALCRDISEVLADEDMSLLAPRPQAPRRIAFQAPCTLQHGQRLNGVVEGLLTRAGFELTPVADAHLCCGSAGTYSILQGKLARRLRANKLAALETPGPALIATANIGCLTHLQAAASVPVKHWIELLA
ncbi:MAG: glycolate oxidase subunit GlcF [Gammaproteobacteria bacterium]